MKVLALLLPAALLMAGCRPPSAPDPSADNSPVLATNAWNLQGKVAKTDDEWRQVLTSDRFRVLRGHGTERAFSGALWNNHEHGAYVCAGCGLELFGSDAKFESGTGWPSFWKPIADGHVGTTDDDTLFMKRTEVHCARCDGHLGHVFDDGPAPTGLRYCINSAALTFAKR